MLVWSVAEYQSGSSCCYVSIATAARLELVRLCGVIVQPAAAAPLRGHRPDEDAADAEHAVIGHGLRQFIFMRSVSGRASRVARPETVSCKNLLRNTELATATRVQGK